MKVSGAWGRLRRLSPRERRDLLEASWLLLRARIVLRLSRPGRVMRPVPEEVRHEVTAVERQRAAALARAVSRAATHGPIGATCLARALALKWLLDRHGLRGSWIRIGVRRDRAFEAHAWIDFHGQILLDEAAHVSGFTNLALMDLAGR